MGYCYQVYTGGTAGRGVTFQDILDKLPASGDISDLIVGWSEDRAVYEALREHTRRHGIRLWLWFPVFSEHGTQADFPQQISISTGAPFGAALFDGDETFDFCCPSEESVISKLLSIYDKFYSGIGFDGIFLDRIRYPSMTMGLDALFGCQCSRCQAWFENHGLTPQAVRSSYEALLVRVQDPSCDDPLGIWAYENGTYRLADGTLQQLISLRCRRITDTVGYLAAQFRERGLLVGLDLFAPFLAPFVGQDYKALSAMADFVKPMLYRLTETPAGIGFELRAMARALSTGSAHQERVERRLKSLYGMEGDGFSFFRREVETVALHAAALPYVRFAPGIEIHTVAHRPPILTDQIRRNVRLLETLGFSERVACWDILSAPEEAIRTFIHEDKE